MPAKSNSLENTDVEPAENIGYYEHFDREKDVFDFNPGKLSDLLNGSLKDFYIRECIIQEQT